MPPARASAPKALVHNDLHHSNLIGTERLYLLDWEYAAVTDPLFDLACVLAYYPQATPHADALLDAARLAGIATPEMLRQATWLYVLRELFLVSLAPARRPPASPADQAAEQGLLAAPRCRTLRRGRATAEAGARPPTSAD